MQATITYKNKLWYVNDIPYDYYADAAEMNINDFTTPLFLMKAGWAYELNSDFDKALKMYERIKFEFPASNEAREIDKYIARAKSKT